MFSAIKSVFKAILKIPFLRTIVQIVACGLPAVGPAACAATAAAFAAAAGGSIGDALLAAASTLAQIGTWTAVGAFLDPVKDALAGAAGAFAAVKGVVHGVVGGAISVAQGGNFLEGFAANAIGAATGVFSDAISQGNTIADTAIVAIAGGAAAVASGGKFANGALRV